MIVTCFHIDMQTIWKAMDVSSRGNLACKQVKMMGLRSIQLSFQLPTFLTTCRGQRANDLLSITVGTQSISPFYWSIDSGAFGAVLLVFLGTWLMVWYEAKLVGLRGVRTVRSCQIKPWRCILHHVPTPTQWPLSEITQSRCPGVCTDNSWRLADHPSRPLRP